MKKDDRNLLIDRDDEIPIKDKFNKGNIAIKQYVHMMEYAVGDGVTDETTEIQAAIYAAMGSTLIWTRQQVSKYLTKKLFIPSNITIIFEKGTIVEAAKGHKGSLFFLDNKENIIMKGNAATIQMVKSDYISEFNAGINVRGCKNVTIDNFYIKDCGGDGIILASLLTKETYFPNENVYLTNNTIDNVKRNGITIGHGRNIIISDNTIKNTNGTSPEAGIDVETDTASRVVENVKIYRNNIHNNKVGIYVSGSKKIKIFDNLVFDNTDGGISCVNNFIGIYQQIRDVNITTNTITIPSHGLKVGDLVKLKSGTFETLSDGNSASTMYYVSSTPSINLLTISSYKYYPNIPIDITDSFSLPVAIAKKNITVTEDIKIYENEINNCSANIYSQYCNNIQVYNNTITDGGIGINFSFTENSLARDNKIDNPSDRGILAVGFSNDIINNKIYKSVKAGIVSIGCSMSRIEGNMLFKCAEFGTESTNCALYVSNSKKSMIANNFSKRTAGSSHPQYGMRVETSSINSERNLIFNNDMNQAGVKNGILIDVGKNKGVQLSTSQQ
ncbi:right-handed parallel beta-helix repeat-containing protein [Peribacillus simplex]|uniref:right-handed parallel beta-helix repeat-containing protein n=1 Tax=Peribacillus simplex TaxID=1478 RepID=UPI003D277373